MLCSLFWQSPGGDEIHVQRCDPAELEAVGGVQVTARMLPGRNSCHGYCSCTFVGKVKV